MRVLVVVHDFLHFAKGTVIKDADLIEHVLKHHAQHVIAADHDDDPAVVAAPEADQVPAKK